MDYRRDCVRLHRGGTMRLLRHLLCGLIAATLVVTPAVAHVAYLTSAGQTTAGDAAAQTASMPDCDRMMMQHGQTDTPTPAQHKTCPDCDKRVPCKADTCQLKCFKVLAAIPAPAREGRVNRAPFVSIAPPLTDPVSLKPQIPPPRG